MRRFIVNDQEVTMDSTIYKKERLVDVAEAVRTELFSQGVTQEQIDTMRRVADNIGFSYPEGTHFEPLDNLWLDYEVQRLSLPKHIHKTIMAKYDPRLHGPAQAARIINNEDRGYNPDEILIYDGQMRSLAACLLGYTEVPILVVTTEDASYPSYAFEQLNHSAVAKLTPGDLHKNRLTRFKLGNNEADNADARTLEDQFEANDIDLQDKAQRKSEKYKGSNLYFMSHFAYAYKGLAVDRTGGVVNSVLKAIKKIYPMDKEIDQGVFIGLVELARLDRVNKPVLDGVNADWMEEVLKYACMSFDETAILHSTTKKQQQHISPGATWTAPQCMSNMLRELYIINGGTELNLPTHGEGQCMKLATNPLPSIQFVS
jgi:hypothetical protein